MKQYEERISVIIPVYNVEKYLRKCLDSVLNQTYKNLEIIIVNDGSTDNSPQILEEYKQRDSRILLIHQKNQGLSAARNTGISLTKTRLLTFIDSDDWIDKNLIEVLYNDLQANNADISISTFLFQYQDSAKCTDAYKNNTLDVYTKNEALNLIFLDKDLQSFAWAKLYKTKLFDKIRFPVGRIYEDYAFVYKLFARSSKIVRRNQPLYHYRQVQHSLSQTPGFKHNYHFFLGLFERYEFALSHPEIIKDWCYYRNQIAKDMFFCLKKMIRLSKQEDNKTEINFVIDKFKVFLRGNTKGVKYSVLLKLKTMVLFPSLYASFLRLTKKNKQVREKLF